MDKPEQVAFVLNLMTALSEEESWCGETHIQKCFYLLQEALDVPTAFTFVLYKHGPYSFDLHDLLGEIRSAMMIEREVRPAPYGPTLRLSSSGNNWLKRNSQFTSRHQEEIGLVAQRYGEKGVAKLERIGTAMYVTLEHNDAPPSWRANEVTSLKPHVKFEDALEAVQDVDELLGDKRVGLHRT